MSQADDPKSAPPRCPSNPGVGTQARVAFANGERTWNEEVDVPTLAAGVLQQLGHATLRQGEWLVHPDSGYQILAQLVSLQPLDNGGVRTTTTLQVNHPTLVPDGVFEYQHSTGNDLIDSIAKGIDQWARTDFVTLLDAARDKPEQCMILQLSLPARDGRPARVRRAVLGPVAHFMQRPPDKENKDAPENHPFCNCCLLTKSFQAFKELFEGDTFYGLRLYAARNTEGEPLADCRVNGDDWEPGAEALRAYALTWPAAGYEFRKQYVVLQNIQKDIEVDAAD